MAYISYHLFKDGDSWLYGWDTELTLNDTFLVKLAFVLSKHKIKPLIILGL